jgi:hypothetical protein
MSDFWEALPPKPANKRRRQADRRFGGAFGAARQGRPGTSAVTPSRQGAGGSAPPREAHRK